VDLANKLRWQRILGEYATARAEYDFAYQSSLFRLQNSDSDRAALSCAKVLADQARQRLVLALHPMSEPDERAPRESTEGG
jgi:hypothetical protein